MLKISQKKNFNYCGRFAPTPTGPLHFGSLVTALASYVDVKANNGIWWLRIDDIDQLRSNPEYKKKIKNQLIDHGLIWDEWPDAKGGSSGVLLQSKRNWWYEKAFNQLLVMNKLFTCDCSRKTIKQFYKVGKTHKLPTGEIAYPGVCKKINKLNNERPTTWRFNSDNNDDFVILRKDNSWSYAFAGVIDDADQRVTRIVRGDDLRATLTRNRIIQNALGLNYPKVLHVLVVNDKDGRKLSKCKGSQGLKNGTHVSKQLKLAWEHLELNMPSNWLERVTDFTESYFF